ncbi:MAG: class I SAM-dependent methyltransferase [Hyphomicrobiaceae bacterium]|nr:class I SAM-dependent methyltransferase [Hyphomicrobiaceae bacterium]
MATREIESEKELPGARLSAQKMPGHWLLARLGKRVLRPGGLAMTESLLTDLDISSDDDVVELAPGLGLTAQMILENNPKSYVGVERDKAAAAWAKDQIPDAPNIKIRIGSAEKTGLRASSASVVLGEAMLSMNSPDHKLQIMKEAHRVLKRGGRYAIHELLIIPDDAPDIVKKDIEDTLSAAIHVGARPLTESEWCEALTVAGFRIKKVSHAPMNLLRPTRLVADEGLFNALRFIRNVLSDRDARQRILTMRRTFHKYRSHLNAISITAQK